MTTETDTQTKIIADSKVEIKEDSSASVTITVSVEEVKKIYDEVLQTYIKHAQIAGFRKGKVPQNVIERKFSEPLKGETMAAAIEKSVEEFLTETEHKPLPYSVPQLKDKPNLELDKDFSFGITYDIFPKIELGNYKKLEVDQAVVTIEKEDIDRELNALAEQNAVVVAKEGKAEAGDIATIDYVELDEQGDEIPNTKRESFTFTIGSGYNLYKIDDEIIGLAKDEEKIIDKKYDDDFEYKDIAGRNVKLKVKVSVLKQKQLPEINDELAQDISERYKTLDDLKADIKSKLEARTSQLVREKSIASLIEKIVGNSTFAQLPKIMIDRELDVKWRGFLRMYRANEKIIVKELEKDGKSKASILTEWKPKVEEGLKSQIVVELMVEKENISVTDEEINGFIKHEAEHSNMDFEEAKKQYNDSMRENVRFSLQKEKLFDILLESAKINKGSKIKYLDFTKE